MAGYNVTLVYIEQYFIDKAIIISKVNCLTEVTTRNRFSELVENLYLGISLKKNLIYQLSLIHQIIFSLDLFLVLKSNIHTLVVL